MEPALRFEEINFQEKHSKTAYDGEEGCGGHDDIKKPPGHEPKLVFYVLRV